MVTKFGKFKKLKCRERCQLCKWSQLCYHFLSSFENENIFFDIPSDPPPVAVQNSLINQFYQKKLRFCIFSTTTKSDKFKKGSPSWWFLTICMLEEVLTVTQTLHSCIVSRFVYSQFKTVIYHVHKTHPLFFSFFKVINGKRQKKHIHIDKFLFLLRTIILSTCSLPLDFLCQAKVRIWSGFSIHMKRISPLFLFFFFNSCVF